MGTPMNCHKCGRFIGPDGDADVREVDNGVYEAGYPTCGRCMKAEARTTSMEDTMSDKDKDRAEFEAAMDRIGQYKSDDEFDIWQAARSKDAERIAELEAELAEARGLLGIAYGAMSHTEVAGTLHPEHMEIMGKLCAATAPTEGGGE